ncbi:hypothetical protein KY289_002391 [Solanum tuberosum]|nr:hypothetical protein KY284_002285 [Solanum tuberosum]KAH0731203.1 hypothetical protein KY289_002391 [Solanum tuberosum]
MRVKLGRGAVLVLLTGSRNGASPEFMVIIHRSWSQKHISNRRKRKRRKGRGTGGETKRGKGRGLAAKRKRGKGRGLAAFALRWSSWMEQVVFEKESNIKDEDEQDRTKMGYIIWWFGSGRIGGIVN